MKKITLAVFLFFLSVTFANALNITSVEKIKKKSTNENYFVIEGILVSKINDYEYIFEDSSGTLKLELEDFVFKNIDNLPLNTKIILKIIVNKKFLEYTKFKVFQIVDIEDTENFNKSNLLITDINTIKKSANNNELFIIKGTILKSIGKNNQFYEIKDSKGNISKVTIQNLALENANIKKFHDRDIVILKIIVRKNLDNTIKLQAYEIVALNNNIKP